MPSFASSRSPHLCISLPDQGRDQYPRYAFNHLAGEVGIHLYVELVNPQTLPGGALLECAAVGHNRLPWPESL